MSEPPDRARRPSRRATGGAHRAGELVDSRGHPAADPEESPPLADRCPMSMAAQARNSTAMLMPPTSSIYRRSARTLRAFHRLHPDGPWLICEEPQEEVARGLQQALFAGRAWPSPRASASAPLRSQNERQDRLAAQRQQNVGRNGFGVWGFSAPAAPRSPRSDMASLLSALQIRPLPVARSHGPLRIRSSQPDGQAGTPSAFASARRRSSSTGDTTVYPQAGHVFGAGSWRWGAAPQPAPLQQILRNMLT